MIMSPVAINAGRQTPLKRKMSDAEPPKDASLLADSIAEKVHITFTPGPSLSASVQPAEQNMVTQHASLVTVEQQPNQFCSPSPSSSSSNTQGVSVDSNRPVRSQGVKVIPSTSRPNEDFYVCIPDFIQASPVSSTASPRPINQPCFEAYSLHAVFDGHGGPHVSRFCSETLHQRLKLSLDIRSRSSTAAPPSLPSQRQVEEALCQAFVQTNSHSAAVDEAGSCGTTACVVLTSLTQTFIANCGDSRAVLCRSGAPYVVTQDHRPNRQDEVARIESRGGQILWNQGSRVMGILATTRAIGDRDLQQYGVIPVPEVYCIPRCGDDDFIILASDGLWNVVDTEESVDVVKRMLKRAQERGASRAKAINMAADALGRYASDRGSRDDITILVLDMQPPVQLIRKSGSKGLLTETANSANAADAVQPKEVHKLCPSPSKHFRVSFAGTDAASLPPKPRISASGYIGAPSPRRLGVNSNLVLHCAQQPSPTPLAANNHSLQSVHSLPLPSMATARSTSEQSSRTLLTANSDSYLRFSVELQRTGSGQILSPRAGTAQKIQRMSSCGSELQVFADGLTGPDNATLSRMNSSGSAELCRLVNPCG